jgi:hypothetical protein
MSRAKQFLSCTNTSVSAASGNKTIISTGLALSILIALVAGNVSYAAPAPTPANSVSQGDPVQTKNTHKKSLKSPHSSRKAAAKRLKPLFQQEHKQQMEEWTLAHRGQGKQGRNGQARTGGVK